MSYASFRDLLTAVLMERFGGNKSAFAQALEMAPSALTRIINGRVPSMSVHNLLALAPWTDVPFLDLLRLARKEDVADRLMAVLRLNTPSMTQAEAGLLEQWRTLSTDQRRLLRRVLEEFSHVPAEDARPSAMGQTRSQARTLPRRRTA